MYSHSNQAEIGHCLSYMGLCVEVWHQKKKINTSILTLVLVHSPLENS